MSSSCQVELSGNLLKKQCRLIVTETRVVLKAVRSIVLPEEQIRFIVEDDTNQTIWIETKCFSKSIGLKHIESYWNIKRQLRLLWAKVPRRRQFIATDTRERIPEIQFESFYHEKQPEPPAAIAFALQHSKPCQLEGSMPLYYIFPTQKEAFEFADAAIGHDNPLIFSYESSLQGKRKFLAASYDAFIQMYQNARLKECHAYEIIRESSPCRLYFDLETKSMAEDHELMIRDLIYLIAIKLFQDFQIQITPADVVDLDSSTTEKFSHHLIVHLPENTYFENNRQAGIFVKSLQAFESIIDVGVYTRNRAFRLLGSSKYKKQAVLKRSDACQYHKQDLQLIDTLVCPFASIPALDKATKGEYRLLYYPTAGPETRRHKNSSTTRRFEYGRTKWPKLDEFIVSLCQPDGEIRSWSLVENSNILTYNMSKYRYCENIGRAHKSNNIMFVVDLASHSYVQKCYDQECQAMNFRSKASRIPENVFND